MNGLDRLVEGFPGPLHDQQMKHHCVPLDGRGCGMGLYLMLNQVVTETWVDLDVSRDWSSPPIQLETSLAFQEAALVYSQRPFMEPPAVQLTEDWASPQR